MESLQSQKVAREKEICPKPSLWCPSMILSFSMAALFFFPSVWHLDEDTPLYRFNTSV